jgi:hypothetical protein
VANVQRHFHIFHKRIRLNLDENQTLREKREIVCGKLRERLPYIFGAAGEDCPWFEIRDQGSYKMGTAVYPLDRDFDIDLGMFFQIDPNVYDPVGLKRVVHAALAGHTRKVHIRRPCVTVQYQQAGQPTYHVDIAVYSDGSRSRDGIPRLAMGKERSRKEFCVWEPSDPATLTAEILGSYVGEDLTQFRRVVRYLKRWKDANFSARGNGAPRGIALTVACHQHFEPAYFRDNTADDLTALIQVVDGMLESFTRRGQSGSVRYDVRIELPVEPYADLCERMTDLQKLHFYNQLATLLDVLDTVDRGRSQLKACQRLRRVFGNHFPLLAG